jgi:hypothetical protein
MFWHTKTAAYRHHVTCISILDLEQWLEFAVMARRECIPKRSQENTMDSSRKLGVLHVIGGKSD